MGLEDGGFVEQNWEGRGGKRRWMDVWVEEKGVQWRGEGAEGSGVEQVGKALDVL